jgi:gamma-glutamyltranspeptidase/glutathione hydrolase
LTARSAVFPKGNLSLKGGPAERWVRRALGVASVGAVLAVSACGDPARDLKVGTIGYISGFAGSVVASEPRAVLVGRDVLSAGGSAADAAVAVAFTMAVTLPSSDGIAAGGVCLVHDHITKKTETLDFLTPPAQASVIGAQSTATGTPIGMPALPRAMYALYAKSGRLRWEQLLAPAEQIARFGEPVSRALSQQMQVAAQRISRDPYARTIFSSDNGRTAIHEGDVLTQLDLATVLGRLRTKGPGDLYGGQLGQQYVNAVQQMGGLITLQALRDYGPEWRDTQSFEVGNEMIHFPPAGVSGSDAATAWKTQNTAPLMGQEQIPNVGGTGFVVIDNKGSAVTCALSMNGPFGVGFMAPGTGTMVVAPGPAPSRSRMPVSVALLLNEHVNEFRFAAAAVGGGAEANVVRLAASVAGEQRPIKQALEAVVQSPAGPALVNGIACMEGVPSHPGSCQVATDPRAAGYGLLVGVDK